MTGTTFGIRVGARCVGSLCSAHTLGPERRIRKCIPAPNGLVSSGVFTSWLRSATDAALQGPQRPNVETEVPKKPELMEESEEPPSDGT